jgi:3-hydroxyacyl-[acyl-carrier-protein] dehydratase
LLKASVTNERIADEPELPCSIIARRRVPLREPWTDAHFPTRALVPGVHLIEGMAQTCGLLARLSSGDGSAAGRGGRLAQVKNAMFLREVLPGAELVYRAERTVSAGSLHRFDAVVSVDDVVVASATLSLALL